MNFAGPLLLLIGPLLAALVVALLGRWQKVSAFSGVILAWLLWAMVTAVPLNPTNVEQTSRLFAGDTLFIVGRLLVLTEGTRALFKFLLAGLSILYLFSLISPQGRYFVAGTMLLLAPLTASLMIEPAAFGALLLLIAMAVLAAIVQANVPGSTRAALRYLIMGVLAIPLVLVSIWMLSTTQTALYLPGSRLLLIGAAILFAGFPFHIWVTPIIVKAPPLVSLFLFGLVQLVVAAYFYDLVLATPWLQREEWFMRTLAQSGIASALIAGLLAATSTKFERLIGSLLLLDMGTAVLALALSNQAGWSTMVAVQLARSASLLLVFAGPRLLMPWQNGADDDSFISLRGTGRQYPLNAALLILGALSLIGMPLTIGFTARWSLLVMINLGQLDPWLPYALLLAMIGGMIGLLRCLSAMLRPADAEQQETFVSQPLWSRGLSVGLLLVGLWLGVSPEIIQNYASRLAQLLG